jgi:hypothetical protein
MRTPVINWLPLLVVFSAFEESNSFWSVYASFRQLDRIMPSDDDVFKITSSRQTKMLHASRDCVLITSSREYKTGEDAASVACENLSMRCTAKEPEQNDVAARIRHNS